MKSLRTTKPLVFENDDDRLSIHYDNQGDPFWEGVCFQFEDRGFRSNTSNRVLLDVNEIRTLRDKLNEFLGDMQT